MVSTEKGIVVLDGGFSSQLSTHIDIPIDGDVLWTSRFTLTHKEAVINTYLDFLRGFCLEIVPNILTKTK